MQQFIEEIKYPNLICVQCKKELSICLSIDCCSSRFFCIQCEKGNGHFDHKHAIYNLQRISELKADEKILVIQTSQVSIEQKLTLDTLIEQIDSFEDTLRAELKILRSNLAEKYSLIDQSSASETEIEASLLQKILQEYNFENDSKFNFEISSIVEKSKHPTHLGFSLFKDSWKLFQENAIDSIKQMSQTVKLKAETEILTPIPDKWGSSIVSMDVNKEWIALVGKNLKIYQQGNPFKLRYNNSYADDPIRQITYSQDGSLISIIGKGKYSLLDSNTMVPVYQQIESSTSTQFHSTAISPDNQQLIISFKSKKSEFLLTIVDLKSKQIKQILNDHNNMILSIKFTNDNQLFACSGCDYQIYIYHKQGDEKYKKMQVLRDNDDIVSEIAISNDRTTLISGSLDGKCFIYTRSKIEQGIDIELNDHQDNTNLSHQEKTGKLAREQVASRLEQMNKLNYQETEVMHSINQKEENSLIKEENSSNTQENKTSNQQKLFDVLSKNAHSNPLLSQSLMENPDYIKYKVEEKNKEEDEIIKQKSQKENFCFSENDNNFKLTSYFTLSGGIPIRSLDIDCTSTYLVLAACNQILVYDIINKNLPKLIGVNKCSNASTINKVKFSHIDNTVMFCDSEGYFQSFRYK